MVATTREQRQKIRAHELLERKEMLAQVRELHSSSLTHSLTHSLTPSLARSLTHSLTHSVSLSHTQKLEHREQQRLERLSQPFRLPQRYQDSMVRQDFRRQQLEKVQDMKTKKMLKRQEVLYNIPHHYFNI